MDVIHANMDSLLSCCAYYCKHVYQCKYKAVKIQILWIILKYLVK